MKSLKQYLLELIFEQKCIPWRIRRFLKGINQLRYVGRSPNKIFYHIYKNNIWDDHESVSGPGSTLKYTKNIRFEIPRLIRNLNLHRILDAPCGDFNWFRFVKLPKDTYYIGGDIVTTLIVQNQKKYESGSIRFITIDIIKDKTPDADLWICRDALFHFSNKDIFLALSNFLRSNIPYILTSSHTSCTKNGDIRTGSFRLLNLELPPFNLCRPILYIDDHIEGYPIRKLCLWTKQAVFESLICNKEFIKIKGHGWQNVF
jgi:hypothetical protein